jgi:hypothetical protein
VGYKFKPKYFNKYLLGSIAISLAVNVMCKISILYFFGVNVNRDYLNNYSLVYYLLMPIFVLTLTTLVFYGVKDFIFNFKARLKTGLIGILISICLGFIFRFAINSPEVIEYLKDYSPYAVGSLIASRLLMYDIFPNILHMDRDGVNHPVAQGGSSTPSTHVAIAPRPVPQVPEVPAAASSSQVPEAPAAAPASQVPFPLYSD